MYIYVCVTLDHNTNLKCQFFYWDLYIFWKIPIDV